MHPRIAITFIFLVGMALGAQAASFDCAKAAKPDEIAICTNADLSALDSEMGGLWFAFRQVPMLMGSNGARMDDAQTFLQQRGNCGGNLACLRPLYHTRISVLRQEITAAMDNYRELQNGDLCPTK
jgi:uncharacterized protein